jgi:hypothetical protein
MTTLLIPLILACVCWAVVASILIAKDLEKHGVPIDFLWLRVMILKYVGQYSKITREETGHVGPLFYHYVIPLWVALVLAVILIVYRLG